MDKKSIENHKKHLLNLKSIILNSGILTIGDDLKVSSDDLADETDLATSVINQQVTFNIRERELRKLREIESALQRIEDKSYGVCQECEEEISGPRLKNQPWTTLCIIHAEEKERELQKFA